MTRRNRSSALRAAMWLAALFAAAAVAAYLYLPGGDGTVAERLAELRATAEDAIGADGGKRLVASENGAGGETDQQEAALPPDEYGAQSRVRVVDGQTTVVLDADAQERAGLRTQTLDSVSFSPEIAALGRVVDLQPLLAQRSRFTAARAQADIARANYNAAKADYERLAGLSREEGDIARKRLLQGEADVKRSAAEVARYESEMRAIREETRQQWGPVLASWALAGSSPEFDRLLSHEESLMLVTLPPGTTLPPGADSVMVARNGERGGAVAASYISPAPVADPMVQGETHFFRTAAPGLRAGMRVDVWAAQSKSPEAGVIVPQDAVVWALGEAWAYVKLDESHFARRAIPTATEAPGGWFVTDAVKPGDSIVVAGAQILYAEEFRWQIRNEDDD